MKRAVPVLVIAFVCLLVAVALLAGCGSSGTASLGDPLAFFNQARDDLEAKSSFRMTGVMTMEIADPEESMTLTYDYDMLMERQESGPIIKMEMIMSSKGGGESLGGTQDMAIEAYITGDRIYINNPATGEWGYEDLGASELLAQVSQDPTYMTPLRIQEMLDAAKTVEVVSEDSESITYKLTLDPELMIDPGQMAEAIELLKARGISEEDLQTYQDITTSIVAAMQLTVVVEKESGLPTFFEVDFGEGLLESMAPLFADSPPPEGASMTITMSFELSEFGQEFNLELPAEAQNAAPLQ